MNNNFIIDVSKTAKPADVLNEINTIVEENELNDKQIILNIGNTSLIPAHVFGIKSLLEGAGASVKEVYTTSMLSKASSIEAGFKVIEKVFSKDENEENSKKINKVEEIIKNETKSNEKIPTLYKKQNLRSGQCINFEGHVLIIGDCHPGSEIKATGDITVWGTINGIAHAGANGNKDARIRALKINAIQLRIADLFSRIPDKLLNEKLEKATSFIPEEASISNNEIIIKQLTKGGK